MCEEKQFPCETCGQQPVGDGGCMAHLDCKLAGQCQVEEGGPYRYYVKRSKDKVFTPPLKLAVLYQVPYSPRPEALALDVSDYDPSGDLELRMLEVNTLKELKEIEEQIERAQNTRNEGWAELQKTEHLARFVIPVDRQLLIHVMLHSGLLTG